MACHSYGLWWNTGASAKPSAGSVKVATATAPAPWAVMFMKRRRVTVSPSNAPGMLRSVVYLDFGGLRRSGNCASGGWAPAGLLHSVQPDERGASPDTPY